MDKQFSEALQGKKIPILTLDNKWYKLLDQDSRSQLSDSEEALNSLLRRQGKLNTEVKNIKKLKKRLMSEIVELAEDSAQVEDETTKKIEQNKKLVEECNEKLSVYKDELLEIPMEIDKLNSRLMMATMEQCYETMHENTKEIEEISKWVTEVRIELKKKLIKKQEMEQKNHAIYSYMHDVFGAEVIDLFDIQFHQESDNL